MRSKAYLIAVVLVFGSSGDVLALSPCPKVSQVDTDFGRIFVDEGGMTLYTFRDDKRYRPHCVENCGEEWLPFNVAGLIMCDEADSNWSIITRPDGQSQWALDGRPLYRSVKDAAPGEITVGGPAWTPAGVPCPAARSLSGTLSEKEAYSVIGDAIANGDEPVGGLRRWCGISVDQLATRANISISALRAHESGERQLDEAARIAITQALGAPSYLLLQ